MKLFDMLLLHVSVVIYVCIAAKDDLCSDPIKKIKNFSLTVSQSPARTNKLVARHNVSVITTMMRTTQGEDSESGLCVFSGIFTRMSAVVVCHPTLLAVKSALVTV